MAATYERKNKIIEFHNTTTLSPLPHLHKELEMIYIIDGGCKAVANRKIYDLHSGDIFITFPYQVHYYIGAVPGKYLVHCFPASVLTGMENTVNSNELINNVFHAESGDTLDGFFQQITAAGGPYSVAERCAYIILILSRLLPQCKMVSLQQTASQSVKNILEYCSKHYTEKLSLDTLSKELHLNKYYISHSINKQINMRLNTFINSLRVDAACKLLKESEKKIADISHSVGYETIRSFNRAFVEIVGTTPKQYREQHIKDTQKQALS